MTNDKKEKMYIYVCACVLIVSGILTCLVLQMGRRGYFNKYTEIFTWWVE
jgi:hypothetical protein